MQILIQFQSLASGFTMFGVAAVALLSQTMQASENQRSSLS
jgi:hypothetical protein